MYVSPAHPKQHSQGDRSGERADVAVNGMLWASKNCVDSVETRGGDGEAHQ